jgi:hypothetical protein
MLEAYHAIETNFRKQSFPEYYTTLYGFAERLDANDLYNTNRPGHIPTGETFREHVTTMKELGTGAERGDSLLKEKRQTIRDLSELDMDASVSYIRTIAINKKDPSILYTLGLPPKDTQRPRRTSTKQEVEIRAAVKHLKGTAGAIVIEGTHVRGGGPYLINLCKGEPVSEESWYNPGGHYSTCRWIVVKGLEPANRYYVRMRTDGPEGPGPWSQTVSIIVL